MQSPRRRILCADDNEDTCLMLITLLGQANYEAKSVTTVAEALQVARSERFDLYILDNKFADGCGVELCRAIREFDAHTPILFYSGAAYESDKSEALKAGAQDYLIKPNIGDIVRTIERLLGGDEKAWSISSP